jgi:biopolymer transport protein ExbB
MFSAEHLIDLLIMGWLSNIPLGIGSIVTLGIFFERLWKFRGLEAASRELASQVIEALVRRDLAGARAICEKSDTSVAGMMLEGLRWQNVSIEDLDRIFATIRAELTANLRRGIWMIGTVGSLAPFVGLFGTVVGIIRAFADMAQHGAGGFAVVANGIAEALIATAAGLGVAIVALSFFNYLQVRVHAVSATYARASERVVQALLFVESSQAGPAGQADSQSGVGDGSYSPA